MDLEQLRAILFWCLVVNSVVYALTALGALGMRGLLCRVHERVFGLDEQATMQGVHSYLATYKLLITAFNFAPWLALVIMG